MKALAIARDIVLIASISVVCVLLVEFRMGREHDRAVRLAAVQAGITRLENVYKTSDGTAYAGIPHSEYLSIDRISRQIEMAIEYQKLAIMKDLISTDGVDLTLPPQVDPPGK
jgi:hypothetical protein